MLSATLRARVRRPTDPHGNVRRSEYAFLVGHHVDTATLARAAELSRAWRMPTHDVLIGLGWVDPDDYARLMSDRLGVLHVGPASGRLEPLLHGSAPPFAARLWARDGPVLVLDAASMAPAEISREVQAAAARGARTGLACRAVLDAALNRRLASSMLRRAIWGLMRTTPTASARSGSSRSQRAVAWLLPGPVLAGLLLAPAATASAVMAFLVPPFLYQSLLRLHALALLAAREKQRTAPVPRRIPDALLPTYTVLVPLYREAHMLPGLVGALTQLDYPPAKLDIKILLEADDIATCQVARSLPLPAHIELVVVPDAQPKTKPKALNYGLETARGSLLTIYDAEDHPEPGQLRAAVAAFREGPADLGCVQASLNIHNAEACWLSKQFALEYSALFDGLLPSLARLGLPMPLGGTSNHFKREALAAAGAWDPFNVTEDADLGLRLYRGGWRTGVIRSTTWEEAPVAFGSWLRQRTRWLKGWMQTYLVHTRSHRKTLHDMGLAGFLAFHTLLGGIILSPLVYPFVMAGVVAGLVVGPTAGSPGDGLGTGFWLAAAANLLIGLVLPMLLAASAVSQRGAGHLRWQVPLMPIYWLLVSIAAYRALWQLLRDPYRWEKTEHEGSRPGSTEPRPRRRRRAAS
jgi:cellulose synthase/poly-beta-1,6-N-acetylglucosamine synthase-like glycosyltransferase